MSSVRQSNWKPCLLFLILWHEQMYKSTKKLTLWSEPGPAGWHTCWNGSIYISSIPNLQCGSAFTFPLTPFSVFDTGVNSYYSSWTNIHSAIGDDDPHRRFLKTRSQTSCPTGFGHNFTRSGLYQATFLFVVGFGAPEIWLPHGYQVPFRR